MGNELLLNLRKKHPRFIYKNFQVDMDRGLLKIVFDFRIEENISFRPEVIIDCNKREREVSYELENINNLAFHLGLIEMFSYWKATCSQEIIIEAGYFNNEQKKWWQNLIFNGMGEFFYTNRIDFTEPNFIKLIPNSKRNFGVSKNMEGNRFLVPVGGGKDSAVTLQILKEENIPFDCFLLNPTKAALDIVKTSGQKAFIVRRKIDECLLVLNNRNYLNGHTPFSALLAFLSSLYATIFGYKGIIFSNECSANEPNLKYLGRDINHQYSKSFDFEIKFDWYLRKYLCKNLQYFSFLRPLCELQIASLMSNYPHYLKIFRSCNKGQKDNIWCGSCAKCVFAFTILYPFLQKKEILHIFGQNLFERKDLLPIVKDLLGEREHKPFDCVGTYDEYLSALYLSVKKEEKQKSPLPAVLNYVQKEVLPRYSSLNKKTEILLKSWNNKNNLPEKFEKILKKRLK